MEQWRLSQRGGDKEDIAKAAELLRESIAAIKEMKQSWEEQPPEGHPTGACVSLLSALVDLLEVFKEDKEFLIEAKATCGELMLEDPVRRKYWRKRESAIETLLGEN